MKNINYEFYPWSSKPIYLLIVSHEPRHFLYLDDSKEIS